MNDSSRSEQCESGLIACHECDFLHRIEPIPAGGKALCTRCGALLYKNIPNSLNRALALNLSAFMLFIMANVFPFITLKTGGRMEENLMISGGLALHRLGMSDMGMVVFLTSFLFPFLTISGMLYILFPIKFGYNPWKMAQVYRIVRALANWSLLSVFMLGVIISIIKLRDLADVIPGISLFSFVAFMVVATAAASNMDHMMIWQHMKFDLPEGGPENKLLQDGTTSAGLGMISCHTCALLVPIKILNDHGHEECPRCESPLHSRKANSETRTWALIFSAILLLVPANIYPVMTVTQFGRGEPNTIFSGVVHLIEGGMWVLALIIFFASFVVPILKLVVLSFLLISVKKKSNWRTRDRTLLFRVTEAVGAWSMVDVYVVAILTGLVNLGSLATIRPGIGVTFFGAVVIVTLLAAHSFDPRLIWDNAERIK